MSIVIDSPHFCCFHEFPAGIMPAGIYFEKSRLRIRRSNRANHRHSVLGAAENKLKAERISAGQRCKRGVGASAVLTFEPQTNGDFMILGGTRGNAVQSPSGRSISYRVKDRTGSSRNRLVRGVVDVVLCAGNSQHRFAITGSGSRIGSCSLIKHGNSPGLFVMGKRQIIIEQIQFGKFKVFSRTCPQSLG